MIRRTTRGGEIVGPAPRSFHRVLRADPVSVRGTLMDLCRSFGPDVPADALGRLELVLAEVLNNIVRHGAGGASPPDGPASDDTTCARTVHLHVSAESGGLRCVVTDTGVRLPGECLAPRSLPAPGPDLPEGGFGWFLIQDLASDLSYARSAGRNCLSFTLPIEDSGVAAA